MQAFHGSQDIKDKYLARIEMHRKADQLVRGIGWRGGKGCAIGCTLESYDHKLYETELGIPEWLAQLEDRIFEGANKAFAMEWPAKFLAAIRPGADLERVKGPFLIFVLESALEQFDHTKFSACKKACDDVIALYRAGETDQEKFKAAAATMAAEAAEAAAVAAWAAEAWAAEAWTPAAAVAAVGEEAAEAADTYEKFANKLLELLAAA